MKTTFDLPPDLVRELKLRAVHEGRKLKDVAADLLKRGLAEPEPAAKSKPARPKIEIQASGLPVVRCAANAPATRMTASDLLALEQQSLEKDDLQRLGHAL
jgi:plasmid stability protein